MRTFPRMARRRFNIEPGRSGQSAVSSAPGCVEVDAWCRPRSRMSPTQAAPPGHRPRARPGDRRVTGGGFVSPLPKAPPPHAAPTTTSAVRNTGTAPLRADGTGQAGGGRGRQLKWSPDGRWRFATPALPDGCTPETGAAPVFRHPTVPRPLRVSNRRAMV